MAITHKCNIRCEMCYFHKELKNLCNLPLKLYKHIIDAVKSSSPCIILSGGEPFIHPDLVNMVTYAKECCLPVQIFTNGTLVKPSLTNALVDIGLDYIDFTLLGNEKSHSQIAQVANSYERFIKNLEYFSKNRGSTKIILNYTITPQALKDINHAVELVNRYNLDGLRIQHYNFLFPEEFEAQNQIMQKLFGMDANTHEIEEVKDVSSMAEYLIGFKKHLSKKIPGVPVQWAPTLTETEVKNWYSIRKFNTQRRCLYPWRGILVDADGKLYPCSKIYLELGNLETEDIFNLWNNTEMDKFREYLKKNLFPACSRCCKL